MGSEYLTGYVKTDGHIVLEKAVINSINTFFAVCVGGDDTDPQKVRADGRLRGALATWFQRGFLEGVKTYGEEYVINVADKTSRSAGEEMTGPDLAFESAGILASGENAYVWTAEGSGFCIMRILGLFGKRRITRVLSSEIGGEEVLKLSSGDMLMICPESWTDDDPDTAKLDPVSNEGLLDFFDVREIGDDAAFDRRLAEFAGEGFRGCVAALAVR